jgi:hypothetical protein
VLAADAPAGAGDDGDPAIELAHLAILLCRFRELFTYAASDVPHL